MQKRTVFRSLGSSPPVHKARGDELKGGPQGGKGLIVDSQTRPLHAKEGNQAACKGSISFGALVLFIKPTSFLGPLGFEGAQHRQTLGPSVL